MFKEIVGFSERKVNIVRINTTAMLSMSVSSCVNVNWQTTYHRSESSLYLYPSFPRRHIQQIRTIESEILTSTAFGMLGQRNMSIINSKHEVDYHCYCFLVGEHSICIIIALHSYKTKNTIIVNVCFYIIHFVGYIVNRYYIIF